MNQDERRIQTLLKTIDYLLNPLDFYEKDQPGAASILVTILPADEYWIVEEKDQDGGGKIINYAIYRRKK